MLGACLLFAAVGCLSLVSPAEEDIALVDTPHAGIHDGGSSEVRVRDYAYQAISDSPTPENGDTPLESPRKRPTSEVHVQGRV